MATKNIDTFTVKISSDNFLNVMIALYGPLETLKFEWVEGICWDIDNKWNAQLNGVVKCGITPTGIEYETDIWNFFLREDEIEEYSKIENLFSISETMVGQTKNKLPLSAISISSTNLQGNNRVPVNDCDIWLHYGEWC